MKNILSDMTVINNKAMFFLDYRFSNYYATILSVFQVQKKLSGETGALIS